QLSSIFGSLRCSATQSSAIDRLRTTNASAASSALASRISSCISQLLKTHHTSRLLISNQAGGGQTGEPVGWVERSETHLLLSRKVMGFASAQPILRAGGGR